MHPERFQLFVANKWDDFICNTKYLVRWAFRGQSNATWDIKTSIERLAINYNMPMNLVVNREEVILERFKRRAHHYLPNPPLDNQNIEWLSLIQHYGGPTRLLDFTHSYYVAAFIAMERANSDAAIWGINLTKIEEHISNTTHTDPQPSIEHSRKFNLRLAESFVGALCDEPSVLNVEPDRINERMAIQQGLFAFPTDLRKSFIENLCVPFEIPPARLAELNDARSIEHLTAGDIVDKYVIKIILPRIIHCNAIYRLNDMNISSTTLFPGLDGYARSFEREMRAKDVRDGLV